MNAQCRLATYGTLGPGRSNYHQLSSLTGEWLRGSVRGDLYETAGARHRVFPGWS